MLKLKRNSKASFPGRQTEVQGALPEGGGDADVAGGAFAERQQEDGQNYVRRNSVEVRFSRSPISSTTFTIHTRRM